MDDRSLEDRRRTMAAVKRRDTDIELTLRRALWARGLRYRLNLELPGRPDIVFPSDRVVVFCDGCFWHGCPKCSKMPMNNRTYWVKKIASNQERDKSVTLRLQADGWVVLRYWGCEILNDVDGVVEDIQKHLRRQETRGGSHS